MSKDKTATAPYNFVSLPAKPLASKIAGVDDLSDETITFSPTGTPIIPGSTLRGMLKNIFKIVTCGTFSGRTETQRKGEDFNDEYVYFRCLMGVGALPWTKDLNRRYKNRMETRNRDGKLVKNARVGFLIHTTGDKYFILPAKVGDNKNNRLPIYDEIFKLAKKARR